ncbi:MAG: 3-phosphoshikimate 1-carboxyvinyltransferase [Betaproteobacteria bacterium]
MEFLDLPAAARAAGTVRLPGSKSISNRALLLAALADGETLLDGVLESDDTRIMLDALRILGVQWTAIGTDTYRLRGAGGIFPVKSADIFVGNSGTSARSLVAALAFSGGNFRVDGVSRMRERPIRDLVDALRQAGADIAYEAADGFAPLRIGPGAIATTKPLQVRGDVSSQFLTGLLQALPLTGDAANVAVAGELISKPYIAITLNLMARFGVHVERSGWAEFRVPAGQRYRSPGRMRIEGDASSASYFLAAGAISGATGGGPVRVDGVGAASIQGDVAFADALERMGARVARAEYSIEAGAGAPLHGIEIDCVAIPDAAMTLAIVALFAEGPTLLRGIGSWRVKETDRIAAMANELRKVGAEVDEGPDWLRVTPPARLQPASIATYDDHRMAMCFSLVTLGGVAIRINDPHCVRKTYPGYFSDFQHIATPA